MVQFLTGDIWAEVNKLLREKQTKTACIAYVTSANLNLTKGDTLFCDASNFEIKFGATSARIIDFFFKKGVLIYSNSNLHSKLLLTDSFLIIGSSNLSTRSAKTLIESAIVTNNDILVSQAKAFCYTLIKDKQTKLLTRKKIDSLLRIKIIRRPFKPKTKSKTRGKKFGDRYWFLSVFPLNEIEYNKIKEGVERTTVAISKKEKIDEQNIGFLRWALDSTFGKRVKGGDQLILRWSNNNYSQSSVYATSPVLLTERKGKFIHIFYDDTGSKKISFTNFKNKIKKLNLEKTIGGTRTMTISMNDAIKLKGLWISKSKR